MNVTIYQVDAFTKQVFKGNPAAVCPLDKWLDNDALQSIASENNLSETAFLVGGEGSYELRWFTPVAEVDLCGHATLATAWVLYHEMGDRAAPLRFQTRSGELRVSREGERFIMDFPVQEPVSCEQPEGLAEALGVQPLETAFAQDYLVLLEDEQTVREVEPDFSMLKKISMPRGVMVTAPGKDVDFVSRWFGPGVGVDEDPVTGSAHTVLTPYWAAKTGKSELEAEQVSPRSGRLSCRLAGDRVFISGSAVKYMEGTVVL